MRSVHLASPHSGDDLTSPAINSTRLGNSHCTGGAVSSMGKFGQDRQKKESQVLFGQAAGRGTRDDVPAQHTTTAGSRTQLLALPGLVL